MARLPGLEVLAISVLKHVLGANRESERRQLYFFYIFMYNIFMNNKWRQYDS